MMETKKITKSKRKKSKSPSSSAAKKKSLKRSAQSSKIDIRKKKKLPRKSRWEEPKSEDVQSTPKVANPEPSLPAKKEDEGSSIVDMLDQREKIIDCLFFTVTGTALQELIPDYLKKMPLSELKKLCLEELKNMTEENIKNVILGKESSLLKDQETQTEVKQELKASDVTHDYKLDNPDGSKTIVKTEKLDDLELCLQPNEDSSLGEEYQVPEDVLEEVAKDLGIVEGDAELLELEMRARAIRSLLKLKTASGEDTEMT